MSGLTFNHPSLDIFITFVVPLSADDAVQSVTGIVLNITPQVSTFVCLVL